MISRNARSKSKLRRRTFLDELIYFVNFVNWALTTLHVKTTIGYNINVLAISYVGKCVVSCVLNNYNVVIDQKKMEKDSLK